MTVQTAAETKLISEYAPRGSFLARFQRWEWMLVALILLDVVVNTQLSPFFLDARNLARTSSDFMEIGLMMLPMVFIIITGNIDLSVASNMGMSASFMGLWLVQECRREWIRQGEELSFDELTRLAADAEPFLALIDPDHSEFLHPGDMPTRIQKRCKATGQRLPQTKGQIVRVALEAVALKYRLVLGRLEELVGRRLDPLHIIGGGTRNRLLNQFTADSTGRSVVAGPVEATAIGNILMQAIGMRHLGSFADARAVVRASFEADAYEPASSAIWDEAYERFQKVVN